MSYDSVITIDSDINCYDYDKALDRLEDIASVAPDRLVSALAAYLSHDQLIQFVGDELVDDWDDLRPDDWDDDFDDDDDEDIEDDDSGEDE